VELFTSLEKKQLSPHGGFGSPARDVALGNCVWMLLAWSFRAVVTCGFVEEEHAPTVSELV